MNKTNEQVLQPVYSNDNNFNFDLPVTPITTTSPIFPSAEALEDEAAQKAAKSYFEKQPRSSLSEALAELSDDSPPAELEADIIELEPNWDYPIYNDADIAATITRNIIVRRKLLSNSETRLQEALDGIPFENFDYSKVIGKCCDNVIGYVQVPLGYAGPLVVDRIKYIVPMATTEGSLIATTTRGCRALSGGLQTFIYNDGMSHGAIARFVNAIRALEIHHWLEDPKNFRRVEKIFGSVSGFAKLTKVTTRVAGRFLYFRFLATTGDDVGASMMKGTQVSMELISKCFPDMEILSCGGIGIGSHASINWILGNGRSVIAEAVIPAQVLKAVLKVNAKSMEELNISKNLVGSAIAGAVGGSNANAANIVTAIFIATGQDTAQVVSSSSCITLMEACGSDKEDLYVSVTMPTMECGTMGGGAALKSQKSCLQMLGINGPNIYLPGNNARTLASVVAGAVLAGELSLMAALVSGELVNSISPQSQHGNGGTEGAS